MSKLNDKLHKMLKKKQKKQKKKAETEMIDTIEEVGTKLSILVSKTYESNEPKLLKLLHAFSKWLDTKTKEL